jgi:uncharacterized membrane protein
MGIIKKMPKIKITKTILFILGIYLIGLGLGHLFFPEQGHQLIKQEIFDSNNPWMAIAVAEMGIMFFVFGIAALIAARNPIKEKNLVFVVVLSNILTDLIRVWAIFFKKSCPGLWIFFIVSVLLWLAIIIFYPRNKK